MTYTITRNASAPPSIPIQRGLISEITEFDITSYNNARTVTVTFVDGGGGDDTITRSAGNFLDDGFQASGTIDITGTASNNATYTITDSATQELTFATGTVTAESDISARFAAGTGLIANVGETLTPSDYGMNEILFVSAISTEQPLNARLNQARTGFLLFDSSGNEPVDATDGGTWIVKLTGVPG